MTSKQVYEMEEYTTATTMQLENLGELYTSCGLPSHLRFIENTIRILWDTVRLAKIVRDRNES